MASEEWTEHGLYGVIYMKTQTKRKQGELPNKNIYEEVDIY